MPRHPKINSISSMYANPLWRIIRKPISSKADLERLTETLGMDVIIDWIDNYRPDVRMQILNIDADHIGGTHWIAIYQPPGQTGSYFDSLGLPIARDDIQGLQYTQLPVQDYRFGGCGLYCVLFLWYAQQDDIDGFYHIMSQA